MKKSNSLLPTSGRIGRFLKFLAAIGGDDAVKKVAPDANTYEKLNPYGKAAWWDMTMVRLEKALGRKKASEIMASCGAMCCGTATRKKAKAIYAKSSSTTDFLERLNKTGMGGGRLILKDNNTIIGGYDRCYCGQVSATEKPFENDIYCKCSQLWLESYFGSIFERPVKVKMGKTIIQGAKSCEFTVTI